MSYRQAFEILEIEMTKDGRAIKKAYAGMVKLYHPEEHPEKWQEIHTAYERAMEYSKIGQGNVATQDDIATQDDVTEPLPAQEMSRPTDVQHIPEQEESDVDFSKLGVIAQQNRFEQKKEYEETLQTVLELLNEQDRQRMQSAKDWKRLLDTPQVRTVQTDAMFLCRIGDVLCKKKISYPCYRIIRQFLQGVSEELDKGLYDDKTENSSLNAWEIANSGLKKATAINGSALGLSIAAAIIVFVGAMWLANRPEADSNQSVTSRENNEEAEYVLIQADKYKDENRLHFIISDHSTLPEGHSKWDWMIVGRSVPIVVEEMAGIENGEQVLDSFVVGCRYGGLVEADVVLCLSDFGLNENDIEVWQNDGTGYREMEIQNAANWEQNQEVVYPFVREGFLYINTQVYEMGDYLDCYPVVLIRKSH